MTRDEAIRLATECLPAISTDENLAVVAAEVRRVEGYWLIPINSQTFVATGNDRDFLFGLGPLAIASDGKVFVFLSGRPVDEQLREVANGDLSRGIRRIR